MCLYPIKCLLSLCPSNNCLWSSSSICLYMTSSLQSVSMLFSCCQFVLRFNMCVFVYSVGGGVQPAVCAPWTPVQEAVCGPLSGLCKERQRHAGWLCRARTAQDGGPDAGLRPVHISKWPDWKRNGLSNWKTYLWFLYDVFKLRSRQGVRDRSRVIFKVA